MVHLRKTFPDAVFHECAVGAADSKGTFRIYPKRDGYSSLFDFLDSEEEPTQTVTVEIERLDDLVGNEPIGP